MFTWVDYSHIISDHCWHIGTNSAHVFESKQAQSPVLNVRENKTKWTDDFPHKLDKSYKKCIENSSSSQYKCFKIFTFYNLLTRMSAK